MELGLHVRWHAIISKFNCWLTKYFLSSLVTNPTVLSSLVIFWGNFLKFLTGVSLLLYSKCLLVRSVGAFWCLWAPCQYCQAQPSLHYFKMYKLVNFWSSPQRPVNTYFSVYSWSSLWKPFVDLQILDVVYLKFFFFFLIFLNLLMGLRGQLVQWLVCHFRNVMKGKWPYFYVAGSGNCCVLANICLPYML